jgi:hypothetical protein
MYADDAQIIISASSNNVDISHAVTQLNEDLESIGAWSEGHGLVLNAQKCT